MKITTRWLLAGATLALCAGAGAAVAADPRDQAQAEAERDAAQDAAKGVAQRATHADRREVHVYRADDDDGPRDWARGEGRAGHLRALLQLRPNQETALRAFLDATAPESHGRGMVRFDREGGARSTPERLAQMEARLAEQQASTRRKIEAIRAFYGQLDERQRKAFDAMPMLMMVGPDVGPMMVPIPISHVRPPHMAFPPDRFDDDAPPPPPPAPPRPPKPPRP
jgi:hypothetical protein